MTVFRSKALGLIFCGALLAVPIAIAEAQSNPAVPPNVPAQPVDGGLLTRPPFIQDQAASPVPATNPVKPIAKAKPQRPSDTPILVQPLAPASFDGVGVKPDASLDNKIWNEDLWHTIGRDTAITLIAKLPDAISSPTLNQLAIRLLSAPALPGDGPSAHNEWVGARLLKLAAIGNQDALQAVLRLVPNSVNTPELAELRQNALWIAGDSDVACQNVSARLQKTPTPYWQENDIVCKGLNGQSEEAQLGQQLLHEQGDDDPTFFALVEMQGGGRTVILPNPPHWTPLDVALARTVKRPIPPEAIKTAGGPVALAFANGDNESIGLKLAAAERAAILNVLTADDLGTIYGEIEPSSSDPAKAKIATSAHARAVNYRAARAEIVAANRAELAERGLEAVKATPLYHATARLYQKMITGVVPSDETYARTFARALYIDGDYNAAQGWLAGLKISANGDTKPEADLLWAYDIIARGTQASYDPHDFAAWDAASSSSPGTVADHTARSLYLKALLRGLGIIAGDTNPDQNSPAESTVAAGDGAAGIMAPLATLALYDAAAAQHNGEAVAAAIIAANGQPVTLKQPALAIAIIAALKTIGLEPEARSYALECLAANRF